MVSSPSHIHQRLGLGDHVLLIVSQCWWRMWWGRRVTDTSAALAVSHLGVVPWSQWGSHSEGRRAWYYNGPSSCCSQDEMEEKRQDNGTRVHIRIYRILRIHFTSVRHIKTTKPWPVLILPIPDWCSKVDGQETNLHCNWGIPTAHLANQNWGHLEWLCISFILTET